jgi:CRISPR-associated protein Csb2
MKTVQPMLVGSDDAVYYLWDAGDSDQRYLETLSWAARHLVALGWGVDLVVGHGSQLSRQDAECLPGERWLPGGQGVVDALRVPVSGTLAALRDRYRGFLGRLGPQGFSPPPPLARFATIQYRRDTEVSVPPFAVFSTLQPDGSRFRAFDPVRRGLTLAGMLRHATKVVTSNAGWEEWKVTQLVLGHGETQGGPRFLYVPIPTVEYRQNGKRRIGAIRRGMVLFSRGTGESEISWLRRGLSGAELVREDRGEAVALLSLLPAADSVLSHYVSRATTWCSVSPIVLPGYDDPSHLRKKAQREAADAEHRKRLLKRVLIRTESLLRRSLVHAGLSESLARNAEIDWSSTGFIAGVDLSQRYGVPSHLRRFPRVHARFRFRDSHGAPLEVPGPLCIGAGRFYGLGLLVAE